TGWISDIRISPRADQIAFLDHELWPDDRGHIAVVDMGGKVKLMETEFPSAAGLVWSPAGDEIWFTASKEGSDRAVYAVTPAGRMREVLTVPGSVVIEDIDANGRLLFSREELNVLARAKLSGFSEERDVTWLDWTMTRGISRDGRLLVFDEQ